MGEESLFEPVLLTGFFDGGCYRLLEMIAVFRNEISQVSILGMVPYHFHRVEVRGIARQPFRFNPVDTRLLQQVHCFAMDTVTIQHQDELPRQVSVEQVQKVHHIVKPDIGLLQFEVQPQSSVVGYQDGA